jgi:hypothetical protein
VDQRLPRPRCPRRWGQDPGAPFALRAVSQQSSLPSLQLLALLVFIIYLKKISTSTRQ